MTLGSDDSTQKGLRPFISNGPLTNRFLYNIRLSLSQSQAKTPVFNSDQLGSILSFLNHVRLRRCLKKLNLRNKSIQKFLRSFYTYYVPTDHSTRFYPRSILPKVNEMPRGFFADIKQSDALCTNLISRQSNREPFTIPKLTNSRLSNRLNRLVTTSCVTSRTRRRLPKWTKNRRNLYKLLTNLRTSRRRYRRIDRIEGKLTR